MLGALTRSAKIGGVRVLIAPDSFGGTMTAAEAATAIAAGWHGRCPNDDLVLRPLSDGGPGLLDVLATGIDGRRVSATVTDPLGRPVVAEVFLVDGDSGGSVGVAVDGGSGGTADGVADGPVDDAAAGGAVDAAGGRTAYVESAQACGLHLVAPAERDAKAASSAGLGELLLVAAREGASRIVVGLGGSATTDGGAGMLAALGWVPVSADGSPLPPGGAALRDCARLTGRVDPALAGVELVLASDVDNPLVGLHGAAAVFGPQKGASADDVQVLDAALTRWSEVLTAALPEVTGAGDGVASTPGAGAAGGLGAALLALGGRRESGIALVRRLVGLDRELDAAEVVLTGEGSFDFQSLRGKVAAGVAAGAAERGVPCLVLAGQVLVGRREAASVGVEATYAVADQLGSVEAALAAGADGLRELAVEVAGQWGGR